MEEFVVVGGFVCYIKNKVFNMDVVVISVVEVGFVGGYYVWFKGGMFVVCYCIGSKILWVFVYIEEKVNFVVGIVFVVEVILLEVLMC